MSITLKNINKVFSGRTVLSGVNFNLNEGDKIAIIGENGTGKSTLLRLVAGEEEPTVGSRIVDGYMSIGFVKQDFSQDILTANPIVVDYILTRGGETLLRKVKKLMKEFKLHENVLSLNICLLSGGQQKIIDLSISFAEQPDYLLLDEPENHIDIFARQVLIKMMCNYRKCLVFVSHDQELINSVTNQIVEIEDGETDSYTGSYQFYLEHKARLDEGKERAWKDHEKKAAQLDRLIKRMREWVQKNPDLGAQLRARKTQLERLQKQAPEKPIKKKRAKIFAGDVDQKRNKRILLADKLKLKRGEKSLLWNTNFAMFFGEKVALVGRNGTGKTSLFKAILGELPYEGVLKLGNNLSVGYFSQDGGGSLNADITALEAISRLLPVEEYRLRSVLASYLIDADHCNRPISTLSGGQRTRLRFCLLFSAKNDLLLLDEPTNHLDPVTWDILVQAIKDYTGTVLLISHDRMFIDQVSDKLWVIEDSEVSSFDGTLTEYLDENE